MKFYLKVHIGNGRKVIAICDENLIGKMFIENELKIEVSERFYKGELVDIEKIKLELEFNSLNVVGENIIKILIELGFLTKEDIKRIQGVPFAMVFEV